MDCVRCLAASSARLGPCAVRRDTAVMKEGVGQKLGNTIMSISTFLLSFVFAFVRGWQLALMMCAALPLLGLTGHLMGSVLGKAADQNLKT
eukprot:SAG31_NODE_42112_length_273_cov_0.591954_1_plen_90_part_11